MRHVDKILSLSMENHEMPLEPNHDARYHMRQTLGDPTSNSQINIDR